MVTHCLHSSTTATSPTALCSVAVPAAQRRRRTDLLCATARYCPGTVRRQSRLPIPSRAAPIAMGALLICAVPSRLPPAPLLPPLLLLSLLLPSPHLPPLRLLPPPRPRRPRPYPRSGGERLCLSAAFRRALAHTRWYIFDRLCSPSLRFRRRIRSYALLDPEPL